MRATYLTAYGGNENLRTGNLPDPVASEGDLLIEIRAAGVNPVEPAMRQGFFDSAFPFAFPKVMGFDISGAVLTAPEGCEFKPGDEVFGRLPSRTQGAYAERVAAAPDLFARKPTGLSHVEAASLPTVGLTTWQALIDRAGLQAGDHVLIQAGAGGIGSFAIQLAKHLGAEVTATASASNQQWMRDLGADHVLDYALTRFDEAGPFDVVYDGVCGPLIERGIDSLKPGGRYVGLVLVADVQSFQEMGLPYPAAAAAAAGVRPYVERAAARGATFHGPLTRTSGAQMAKIAALVQAGAIKPTVTAVYSLEELGDAYDVLASNHARGKLVVRP